MTGAGLPETVFAGAVPNNYDRSLQELVQGGCCCRSRRLAAMAGAGSAGWDQPVLLGCCMFCEVASTGATPFEHPGFAMRPPYFAEVFSDHHAMKQRRQQQAVQQQAVQQQQQ